MIRWAWNPRKARTNLRDHGVSFGLAQRVFGDPELVSRPDPHPDEERWQSIGRPSPDSEIVLFVVHTEPIPGPDGVETGRIISARKATRHERAAYEDGGF